MISIKVTLNSKDLLRWRKALNKVTLRARHHFEIAGGQLPKIFAREYILAIRYAIMSQQFPTSTGGLAVYMSHTQKYTLWKSKVFPGTKRDFWRAAGDLLRALNSFRDGRGWFGGIWHGVYDSGGKSWHGYGLFTDKQGNPRIPKAGGRFGPQKQIAMYGRVLEYGLDHPKAGFHYPRPLFGPTLDSMLFGYSAFHMHLDRAKADIGKNWS